VRTSFVLVAHHSNALQNKLDYIALLAARGVAGSGLGNSLVMISPKIAALTLSVMLAAGSGSAAASTVTPGTSPAHGAVNQGVMPRAPSSKSPMAAPTTSCHPTTAKGHCYQPGEYCRKSDLGKSGLAGDGAKITCKYVDGRYRWARV
jgi:hypothetical protein